MFQDERQMKLSPYWMLCLIWNSKLPNLSFIYHKSRLSLFNFVNELPSQLNFKNKFDCSSRESSHYSLSLYHIQYRKSLVTVIIYGVLQFLAPQDSSWNLEEAISTVMPRSSFALICTNRNLPRIRWLRLSVYRLRSMWNWIGFFSKVKEE